MTEVRLEYPKDEAVQLVKDALDDTRGVDQYHEQGSQIVAKTDASFPRVLWSYGETITIDVNEAADEDVTPISVDAEKDVPLNVGANPRKFKGRFINELDTHRGKDVDTEDENGVAFDDDGEYVPLVSRKDQGEKEVATTDSLSDGGSTWVTIVVVTMLAMTLFWMLMIASMPY